MPQLIDKYFPQLSETQLAQFDQLAELLREWNEKINLVSRKDIEHLEEHHLLHSLGIGKVIRFTPGTKVMDVGTGGGLPGLPLAILFPDSDFLLIDSIGKKIKVVEDIVARMNLKNVHARQARAEEINEKFDFITGRGVTRLPEFAGWVKGKIKKQGRNGLPNGILYLKGGDLIEELQPFGQRADIFPMQKYFEEPFFETKNVVYIEMG